MSGPEDLARLTVTIDTANELFLSEVPKMVDVGGGVMRPTNAKVLGDLAAQMSGALIYASLALGLAGTVAGGFFSVLSNTAAGYVDLYQNVGGAPIFKKSYPSAEAVAAIDIITQANAQAVSILSKLLQDFPGSSPEVDVLVITDSEGGKFAGLTNRRLQTIAFDVVSEPGQTSIGDGEGGVVLYADDERVVLGELEMVRTPAPGIYLTDREGGIFDPNAVEPDLTTPFQGGLLFSPVIATSDLHETRVYSQGLLRRRERSPSIALSIGSTTTSANATGASVAVSASKFGPDAVLNARLSADPDSRKFMPLVLKHVPVQTVPRSPKILLIGDSIMDRQGGLFLKAALEELGFTPVFIGTIETSGHPTDVWDTTGPLSEARAGWQTGDYTYSVNDRAFIVAPGNEAAYLALPKASRRERNVFLRPATGSDDPSIVRNGYVFDPAFYQARFNLATPDIIVSALGTNDALDFPASALRAEVLANDLLMNKQFKAAWPNAKIIRTLPASAFGTAPNALWETSRSLVIEALIEAAATGGNPNLTVAPAWAMTNPEVGYAFGQSAVGADGFYAGTWLDAIHPTGSSRIQLYQALAPYIAAAALNLI